MTEARIDSCQRNLCTIASECPVQFSTPVADERAYAGRRLRHLIRQDKLEIELLRDRTGQNLGTTGFGTGRSGFTSTFDKRQ